MSDYPRPEIPDPPARPYLPDRVVAALGAMQLVVDVARWCWASIVRWKPYQTEGYRRWGGDLAFYAIVSVLYLWILWAFARNRQWGFVTMLLLLVLALVGHELSRSGLSLTFGFTVLFFFYTVARLFRLLGPRLLRRRDLARR